MCDTFQISGIALPFSDCLKHRNKSKAKTWVSFLKENWRDFIWATTEWTNAICHKKLVWKSSGREKEGQMVMSDPSLNNRIHFSLVCVQKWKNFWCYAQNRIFFLLGKAHSFWSETAEFIGNAEHEISLWGQLLNDIPSTGKEKFCGQLLSALEPRV